MDDDQNNSDSYSSEETDNIAPINMKSMATDMRDNMNREYVYPDPSDPDLLYKLYRKREFYYNKMPERPNLVNYDDIKEYRDGICDGTPGLFPHQALISNFINPDTPYKGIVLFHGLGTGKCIAADSSVKVNNIYMTIANIWDMFRTHIIHDNDGGEWSKPSRHLYVDSYDEVRNIMTTKPVRHLYRERVHTYLERITLSNGRYIDKTSIHKLYDGTRNMWISQIDKSHNVMTCDGNISYHNVVSNMKIIYDDYVYDLEIDETHNFVANGIVCHNTCACIAIAEKFKAMVQKYNTKIVILVPGPLLRENWKKSLLSCTGETYLKYVDKTVLINKDEKERNEKMAIIQAMQYYRFMSYRSFYKRVLGEKIIDKRVSSGDKEKKVYRKTDEGDFERDVAVDRIYNMNNTLLIIDEAHNLTGNAYGESLKYIIRNSTNLRVVLATATPMKNLAEDIVELLNFVRPHDAPIERERVFTNDTIDKVEFKPGGLEYFKQMARGYVSHIRGADPLIYAKRIDKGKRVSGLLFTKVIECKMSPFQKKYYDSAVQEEVDDTLDRKSEAVANFVIPGLTPDKKAIDGHYGRKGIVTVRNQLQSHYDILNKKIATDILKLDNGYDELIYPTTDNQSISGKILHEKYLATFSTKFHAALRRLNSLVWGKKGPRTAFVYSNLVKTGIELFQETLLQNGYLEFDEDSSKYKISDNTRCYYCGIRYKDHNNTLSIKDIHNDDTTSDYDEYKHHIVSDVVPKHEFAPATFISVTGNANEETAELLPEDKKFVIDNYFNKMDNIEGKRIKLILGSKVMNEGISLMNVSEVHILDVYFNLGRVDQVVGRAIRWCSHYRVMSERNIYPVVNVYKYVVSVDNGVSTEIDLYKRAEAKYMLIKKVERAMKEVAIDCPLNMYGNMFKEEIDKYKDCQNGTDNPCPVMCDYTKCLYTCDDVKLNAEHYDPQRKIYKVIGKNMLDYSTFVTNNKLAKSEIEFAKNVIKELYLHKYVYKLGAIIDAVRNNYDNHKRDLFDEFFVFRALDELLPVTSNDFNNFRDTVIDKFNRSGYLIYRDEYYIFQPFDQNEDVPMYYRTTNTKRIGKGVSLYNYIKNTDKYKQLKSVISIDYEDNTAYMNSMSSESDDDEPKSSYYDFDSVMEYYNERPEFKYVGIIDKSIGRRKIQNLTELDDIFKIREQRAKILDKKRGTGIPSLKGAVCTTAKSREYLGSIMKSLGLKLTDDQRDTRDNICNAIRTHMLEMEKYSTGKDKKTYIMIPANHPTYSFPYNLEDRIEYIKSKLQHEINVKMTYKLITDKHTSGPNKDKPKYRLTIKFDTASTDEYKNTLHKYRAYKVNGDWTIDVE